MTEVHENNLVRFSHIKKSKEGIFAHFKIKGLRAGVTFTASISVDLAAAEVDAADPLEKIIEHCARIGVKEFKRAEFQFEGLAVI